MNQDAICERLCRFVITADQPQCYQDAVEQLLYRHVCFFFAEELHTQEAVRNAFQVQILTSVNEILGQFQQSTVDIDVVSSLLKRLSILPELEKKMEAIYAAIQELDTRLEVGFAQFVSQLNSHGVTLQEIIDKFIKDKNNCPARYSHGLSMLGTSLFVGRRSQLDDLHQKLLGQPTGTTQQVAIVAAAGMGGVGKTALARAYVRDHQADYPGGIWWLRVKGVDLVSEILTVAAVFGWEVPDLPIADPQQKQIQQIGWCWQQWQTQSPGIRLLVLDDVPKYEDVRHFLPTDASFRVLLTSRNRFGTPVQRLDLGVMKRAEAFRTLRCYVGDDDRIRADVPTAKRILEWLGYLPLGIELVGKYLERRPSVTLEKLWQRLQDKRLDARAIADLPEERVYEYNLRAALDLSWQELSPMAQQVAGLLASFALAPIPQPLIGAALPSVEEEDLEDALDGELVRGSMVQDLGAGRYQLHQLVREYVRDQLANNLKDVASALRQGMVTALVAQAKTVNYTVTLKDLARMQDVVPHLTQLAEEYPSMVIDEDVVWPFFALARLAQGQSRWQEAERWYGECLTMTETRFGQDHPDVATSLNNLAELYRAMGRYGEAEPLYGRSLAIDEKVYGTDHPDVATSLNNLALLYESMGRYGEAEPLYERSLAIAEQQLGADHPDVATSLNNLAGLYESMGRYGEAEPLYERSLAIAEQQLGADHPDVATSLNNLAGLYYALGRYGEAEPLYERSLSIREQQLRADHPDVATSLHGLAGLYYSMGRYGEVETLYQRSLSIYEQQLGPDHPDVATSLNNLALLYRSMGRYGEAEPLYERSLAIAEQQLGADHPSVATSLNNLAELYRSMGRYGEAEPVYARSLSIYEQQLGADHPSVAASLNNLANLYYSMGRYGEAEPLVARSLSIREQQLGADHPSVAASLNNLAGLYSSMGRYGEAEPLVARSLSIREQQLGVDHPDVAKSLWNIAALYLKMQRLDDAKPAITRAVQIFEKTLGQDHPDTVSALHWWQMIHNGSYP
ncbi:tetratricopeptide repeat protein [Leptolyngbya sp. CCY15150]|uniref:tetratricopeptide repeat protein n=1 Tax=Leptolyngbya sp. CCY15150 TaxID=2767772 RepID=UPI00194FB6E0